jgi:hypothetical protein
MMGLQREYQVLIRMQRSAFEIEVQRLLNDGWQLHGGPSITALGTYDVAGQPELLFAQALVRHSMDENTGAQHG